MSAAVQLVFLTRLLATVQACRAADEIVNRCDLCSAHNSSYRDAAEISGRNQVAACLLVSYAVSSLAINRAAPSQHAMLRIESKTCITGILRPELVERCLEFLPFEEVHTIGQMKVLRT